MRCEFLVIKAVAILYWNCPRNIVPASWTYETHFEFVVRCTRSSSAVEGWFQQTVYVYNNCHGI